MILLQACRSLGEAHARGLVHRDIKPANLALCRVGDEVDVVKVLDFRLVAAVGGEPGDHGRSVQGTPAFMSPEQASGQAIDGRTDLYSLGCVAHVLLRGQPPFPGREPQEVMAAHVRRRPPTLPGVPPALAALVTRLLAKDPAERPATAGALAAELADLLPTLVPWTATDAQAWWSERPATPPGGTPIADDGMAGDDVPRLLPLRSAPVSFAGITVAPATVA